MAVEGQTYIVMACLYTPAGALLAGYERVPWPESSTGAEGAA